MAKKAAEKVREFSKTINDNKQYWGDDVRMMILDLADDVERITDDSE